MPANPLPDSEIILYQPMHMTTHTPRPNGLIARLLGARDLDSVNLVRP